MEDGSLRAFTQCMQALEFRPKRTPSARSLMFGETGVAHIRCEFPHHSTVCGRPTGVCATRNPTSARSRQLASAAKPDIVTDGS